MSAGEKPSVDTQKRKGYRLQHYAKAFFIISFLSAIFGLILLFSFNGVLDIIIKFLLKFDVGTEAYERWVINDASLHSEFVFYNWSNPEDFEAYINGNFNGTYEDAKPRFTEVGPFRFNMFVIKSDITVHDNGTTTYMQSKMYIPYEGPGYDSDLSQVITTINPIANTIAFQARHFNFMLKLALSLALGTTGSKLYVRKTIDELLFKGYRDPILDAVSKIPFSGIQDRFGYLYKRNYTDKLFGPYNFNSANDDKFGTLNTLFGQRHTGWYPGQCGEVRGEIGEFSPMHKKKEPLELYSIDLCSHIKLIFDKEETVKGVRTYKYSLDGESIFDNGFVHEENSCFCNGECAPRGLLNISKCNQDAPFFLSAPKYYLGDPTLLEDVGGLIPNEETDNLYVSYEPLSGVILKARLCTQLNTLLQPIPGISLYSKIPKKIYFPIFHTKEILQNADDVFDKMKLTQMAPSIANATGTLLIIFGLCLAGYFYNIYKQNQKANPDSKDDEKRQESIS